MKSLKQQLQNDPFWFFLKFSFSLVWLCPMFYMAHEFDSCPYPTGVCTLYHFNFMFSHWGIYFTVALLLLVWLFYLHEKQMLLTTLLGFLLTAIIVSHHESNGIYKRATALSLIWMGHFLAYLIVVVYPKFDLKKFRYLLPVQFIAALYFLAAFSKLYASGLGWASEGAINLPLSILKSARFEYYSKGNELVLDHAQQLAVAISQHPFFIKALLWISLLLELFCPLVVLNSKWRAMYGLALLLMHIGIYWVMDILIAGQVYPMLVFFVNPLYHMYFAIKNNLK